MAEAPREDSGSPAVDWCFTVYDSSTDVTDTLANREERLLNQALWDPISYLIIGREVCPITKKDHLQGFLQLKTKRRKSQVIALLTQNGFSDVHCEKRHGPLAKAVDYCKEDGDFREWGELRTAGVASDLKIAAQELIERKFSNIRDFAIAHPTTYIRNHNGIDKMFQMVQEHTYRDLPSVFSWTGATGTGKSSGLLIFLDKIMKIPRSEWYLACNDKIGNQWWPGYFGQTVVIWNDFKGQYPINDMLRILDRDPLVMDTKGGHTLMRTNMFCFTANQPLDQFYHGDWQHDAWCRRLKDFAKEMPPYILQPEDDDYLDLNTHRTQLTNLQEAYTHLISQSREAKRTGRQNANVVHQPIPATLAPQTNVSTANQDSTTGVTCTDLSWLNPALSPTSRATLFRTTAIRHQPQTSARAATRVNVITVDSDGEDDSWTIGPHMAIETPSPEPTPEEQDYDMDCQSQLSNNSLKNFFLDRDAEDY